MSCVADTVSWCHLIPCDVVSWASCVVVSCVVVSQVGVHEEDDPRFPNKLCARRGKGVFGLLWCGGGSVREREGGCVGERTGRAREVKLLLRRHEHHDQRAITQISDLLLRCI